MKNLLYFLSKNQRKENDIMKKRFALALILVFALLTVGCQKEKTKKNTIHSLDDLEGKKIGVQLKTTGDVYASDIKNAQVERFNKGRDAVVALQNGVIDAVMLDDAPANVFVEEFRNVTILKEPYAKEEYGIAVRKENTELLEKINQALQTLKENGTLNSIVTAWIKDGEEVTAYPGNDKKSYPNGTLIMATNAEFPPYESLTEDNSIIGIDVDIMKEVCDELDMKLKVENTAFDSILSSVERDMVDVGVAAMTITDDRLQQVNFSIPYMEATQVIIVRED